MKLNRLSITDFVGIRHAEIDLSSPVSIFLGDNNAGKTSIKDALQFVFTGGLVSSRGYYKKNQADRLQHREGKQLSVTLETDCGEYHRTAKSGTTPPINPDLAVIAINPQSVLTMPPAERQAIFGKLLSNAETIQNLNSLLVRYDYSEFQIKTISDIDTIQNQAIENRKAAKRSIESIKGNNHAPESIIKIGEQEFDLSKFTVEYLMRLLAQRQSETSILNQQIGAAKSKLAEIERALNDTTDHDAAKAELQQIESKIGALQKDLTAAETANKKAADVARQRIEPYEAAKREEDILADKLNSLERLKDGGECPICQRKLVKSEKDEIYRNLRNQLDSVKAKLVLSKADYDEAENARKVETNRVYRIGDELKAAKSKQQELTQRATRQIDRSKLSEEKNEIEKYVNASNDKLDDLNKRIVNLNTLLAKSREYEIYQKVYQGGVESIQKNTEIIKRMDALDQMMKPDGEIRTIANKSMESAAFDMELATAWGMESLKLESDGTISLFGDPIEAASTSQQYRAGILLAELLSRSIGLGILVLDGLDVLSDYTRGALSQRMNAWTENFKNIILLRTVADKPETIPDVDWMKVFWVDGGIIEQIKAEKLQTAQ